MASLVQHNVNLQDYCTFKIGGTAANFAHVKSREDLVKAVEWAREHKLPMFILGEGSNLIFGGDIKDRLIAKIEIPGCEVLAEDADSSTLKIGAGEHWDGVVARSVAAGLSGIEAMSMIPGTAGATPIQNVGAYGQEIKDTLVQLEAYDIKTGSFITMTNPDCQFSYRDSIFKSGQPGRFLIVSITLTLSKHPPAGVKYESLQKYLDEHKITNPTIAQVREAVMVVRADRLPDPSVIPNVGSFFGNPIVDSNIAEGFKNDYPDMPAYPAGEGKVKLAAGWLIEQAGLRGQIVGRFKIYDKHAQVLTNPEGASYQELQKAVAQIVSAVESKFGVTLEQEPQVVE